MASVNQGYVTSFNLSETIDETLTINNLGGGSISDDLSIFAGNTKNTSKIVYKPNTPNFSITETAGTTLFKFDLLSCYGNGDPIKIKIGKIIADITYDYAFDELTVVFDGNHDLTSDAVGNFLTINNSYFDGPGTTFFNEKQFRIASIPTTSSITILNTGYIDVFEDEPGTFDPSANLAIGQTSRYVYATTTSFNLPAPLSYTDQYYTVLTNGIDQFKIATYYGRGQLIAPIQVTGNVNGPLIFERSNAVTQQNLVNLARPDFEDTFTNNAQNIEIYYNGVLDRSFNDNFDYLESILDSSNFFRLKKYRRSQSNTFDENPIKLEGNLRTLDPDNYNSGTEEIFAETSPGIFIIDPESSADNVIKLRSFSDNTSPWEYNGVDTLEYSAQSLVSTTTTQGQALAGQTMSIGNMILKGDPIAIENLQGVVATSSPNTFTPIQKFTHKLPVLINGEEYNVLLTNLTPE